jgi:hypothetical protein
VFVINCFCGCTISCDAPRAWVFDFQDSASLEMEAFVILHNKKRLFCLSNIFNFDLNNKFDFSAFYNKYNTHLPNNKIPSENFLTWLVGFTEGEGSFLL